MTNKRPVIWFICSLALSAAILFYLFQHISLAQVFQSIKQAYKPAIAVFCLLSLSMSLVRTWRYLILLGISGHRPPTLAMFLLVLVRNFFSDLLPARLGTLVYIFLLNTRLGVSLAAASSSFALATLFDLLGLAPILFVAILSVGVAQEFSLGLFLGFSLLLAVCAAAMIWLLPRCLVLLTSLTKSSNLIKSKYKPHLRKFFEEVDSDVRKIQRRGLYFRVFALSILGRFLKYATLYSFLYALLEPLGYGLSELHFGKVMLGLCASELSASLPISGIAGFGAYQGAWVLTFSLLGFPLEIAQLTSLSHHLFTQLWGYSIGIVALLILCSPILRIRDN